MTWASWKDNVNAMAEGRPTDPLTDHASEYGRLLAERDRLMGDGVEPDELVVPLPPETGPTDDEILAMSLHDEDEGAR